MEVKHKLSRGSVTKSTITALLLVSILACEKKKEAATVIDDNNSQFAGKSCYGEAIKDQYLVKWSDNTYSTFHGTKSELESYMASLQPAATKTIVHAEQDRFINKSSMTPEPVRLSGEDISTMDGNFWQIWGQEDIQVSTLWENKIKGNGVLVAVVDDGVDITHPALQNRIAINDKEIPNNNIDDDGNGLIDDYMGYDFDSKTVRNTPSGHGTHVAGIIAAEPKGNPMSGMAPETKILPLDIMSPDGGTLTAAVFAINYAEKRGAKIINASWGGSICAESLKQAIVNLKDKGILFINASGNSGYDLQTDPEYPAAYNLDNQVTVGATVQSGLMAAFSNYGYTQVHVLAPGFQILSSVPGGWGVSSGTSMATPFVSGLAALLWSAHPEATMEQIKKSILQSVKEPKDYNPVLSKGRINAPLALEKLEVLLKP